MNLARGPEVSPCIFLCTEIRTLVTAGRWVTLIDCIPCVNKIPRTRYAGGVADCVRVPAFLYEGQRWPELQQAKWL